MTGTARPVRGKAVGDMSREPSMEDILSSIRKVIAREDAPSGPTLARGVPAAEPDILELDEESHDDGAAEAPLAAPVRADELVDAAAADAARRSLDALSAAVAPADAAPAAPAPTSRTLDDVVTEALRPMLKAWLDTNLPPLVEAMVAKEIARITGRRI
jgi:uncharacterized protein